MFMFLLLMALFLSMHLWAQIPPFREMMRAAPPLPLQVSELPFQSPNAGWGLEMVSSVAVDGSGAIYLLQRGSKADPVIVVNRDGRILRSWGKGLYKIPHSIRVDPRGDIWTVDAARSMVYKFSPQGKKLLEINAGGLPAAPKSP